LAFGVGVQIDDDDRHPDRRRWLGGGFLAAVGDA